MLNDLFQNIRAVANFEGVFFCEVASGYLVYGLNSRRCSLSDFKISGLTYDAEHYLLSLKLSRAFPIMTLNETLDNDREFNYETVEVILQYCLLKNCPLTSSVSISPSKIMTSGYINLV